MSGTYGEFGPLWCRILGHYPPQAKRLVSGETIFVCPRCDEVFDGPA